MKIQVGLFFGGKSVEHEVSVISAAQAAAAMDADQYDIIPVYISKDNEFYTGSELITPANYRDLPGLLARSQRVTLARDKGKVYLMRYPHKILAKPVVARLDIALPVVHGTNAEDGSIQGLFRLYGLPYAGSDVGASACGMDKWVSKCLLQSAGLPVLPGYCFSGDLFFTDPESLMAQLEAFHGYPLVIKPVNLGSSVGISAVHDREELREGVELAASFAERILIEPMLVHMREINCSVLGDADETQASVCEEPLSTGEILSYRDKYQSGGAPKRVGKQSGGKGMGGALRKLPADLEKEQEDAIRSLACKAFAALNCSGVARVDFLMDKDTNTVYVNEINTIPGSLSFYLWEATGKSFPQLMDELIRIALKRNRMQERLIWSNDANLLSGLPGGIKGRKS